MGKSILILLILIITLVAAPFFGSFGEALDKPVVSAASTLSEYLFNQLSNSQDHLNQSLTVPERTAMYYECLWFTYESEVEFSVEIPDEEPPGGSALPLPLPEPWEGLGFTVESDIDVHTVNPYHYKIVDPMDPIQIGPAIISEPFGYA